MGKWDRMSPDLRAICSRTPVNGRAGDAPEAEIQYSLHGGSHLYLIFYLNAALRGLHPARYPRIDPMPEFIWRVRDKVTKPFV